MKVDFSEWYVDEPHLLARRYNYSDMDGARDLEMQVLFTVEPGTLSIHTFAEIRLSDLDLHDETMLRLSLQPMDGTTAPTAMMAIGAPVNYPQALVKLFGPDDARGFLDAFSRGKDMHFAIDAADGEKLLRLPLPNDADFWPAYSAKYDLALAGEGKHGLRKRIDRIFGK